MDKTLLYLNSKTSKLINRISVPPFQKQPFADIHRKTPVFESLSNKVVIKKKLQRRCFTMNIAKFFRKAFFIEQIRWLLLPFTTTFTTYYWETLFVYLFTFTHFSKRLNTCLKLLTEKVDQGVKCV